MSEKLKFNIANNLYEMRAHGDFAFPFEHISSSLSRFATGYVECHWHPEIEINIVTKGEMTFHVNEAAVTVSEGNGLFICANSLHMGSSSIGECEYQTFIFHPRLIYGFEKSAIQQYCYAPIFDSRTLSSLFLSAENPAHREIVEQLLRLSDYCAAHAGSSSYQYYLDIQIQLLSIWKNIVPALETAIRSAPAHNPYQHPDQVKQLLNFIHVNYMKKLSLHDIAAVGNLCESECCRLFKRSIHLTPFQYLMNYRIQISLRLLNNPELSIADVAINTGFQSGGYFSEVFKRQMGISPREYRKLSPEEKQQRIRTD